MDNLERINANRQCEAHFATTMLRALDASATGNVLFSPQSLRRALAMVYLGTAEGSPCRTQFFESLGLPGREEDFLAWLLQPEETSQDSAVESATAMWISDKIRVRQSYADELARLFKAIPYQADFTRPQEVREALNRWADEHTHGKIKESAASINRFTRLVLTDALYFKDEWEEPFYTADDDTFRHADGSSSAVPMMGLELDRAWYAETPHFQRVSLSYAHPGYAMQVILPREGVDVSDVVASDEWLSAQLSPVRLDLTMPKFEIRTQAECHDYLKQLGLWDIFTVGNRLPLVTDTDPLYVDSITQQAYLLVQEEGTEAAALTEVGCRVGCCPPEESLPFIEMKVDRPFAYAIMHEWMGQILFAGIIHNLN